MAERRGASSSAYTSVITSLRDVPAPVPPKKLSAKGGPTPPPLSHAHTEVSMASSGSLQGRNRLASG